MKKNILLSVILLTVLKSSIYATIITVDNNPGNLTTYTTAQGAHDAVSTLNGDTLYLIGSAVSYGNLNLTKKLFIYGPGYFIPLNPNTQANVSTATLSMINFAPGSSGSMLTGISFTGNININVNNIMIKRCCNISSPGGYAINLSINVSNCLIIGNYIKPTVTGGINISGGCNNNIIKGNLLLNASPYCMLCNFATTTNTIVENNVIDQSITCNNCSMYNNIATGTFASLTGSIYYNNIGNSAQFGTANGNQQNVPMGNIFKLTGSVDEQYQLKAGSPAIGAGFGGVDCGAFAGTDPYILSGIPSIPHIYYFNAPASGSAPQGLPVTIKIKSQN